MSMGCGGSQPEAVAEPAAKPAAEPAPPNHPAPPPDDKAHKDIEKKRAQQMSMASSNVAMKIFDKATNASGESGSDGEMTLEGLR